jgi:hypothetical protein
MSTHPRYTNAPRQHPHLIWGSFHLCFWILFHPAAWRNHVARLDPGLPPDFKLLDLDQAQWRRPGIRRLIIQIYLVLPLLASAGLALFFWQRAMPTATLWPNWLHFTAIIVTICLLWGGTISVASGLIGGLALGIITPLSGEFGSLHVFNIAIGAGIGLAASVNPGLIRHEQHHAPGRQIGSITIGIIVAISLILMRYGLEEVGLQLGLAPAVAYALARSVQVGGSFGLVAGWLHSRQHGWRHGWRTGLGVTLLAGLLYVLVYLVTNSPAPNLTRGLTSGMLFGLSLTASFVLPYALATYLGGIWAGTWAGALSTYGRHISFAYLVRDSLEIWLTIVGGLAVTILGVLLAWWRPVLLYPLMAAWNLLLYQLDLRRNGRSPLLRWHSAFWDEKQYLPLYGLHDHLLLILERDEVEGEAALAYLATSSQRQVAQTVQIERDARRLEQCAGVMALRRIHHHLSESQFSDSPTTALLFNFSQISRDVDAALNQTTAYNQRQALQNVSERLTRLERQLTQSNGRYAPRFYTIAGRWQHIIADRIQELTLASETRQEINSPYVIGMPLSPQQEIFVGRREISLDIERFLLMPNCPPLFLYGQRRMGKTSLLNNLGRLLPSTILPLFVDLQGPASWASDHTGFLYSLAQGMIISARQQRELNLPYLSREVLGSDPFIYFNEWLNEVEHLAAGHGQATILLALDEFEALDDALAKERFDETAVLGLLRHIIQHRPRFKLLLAGSHALAEFQRWASYLINVRLLHLDYLHEEEARHLIERPIQEFPLRYEAAASQRVLDLTRGHPFLVQLLCHEIVALKNQQAPTERRLARLADVETAVGQALAHGDLYFADIYYNRVDEAGLTLLTHLAAQGEGGTLSQAALADRVGTLPDLRQTLTHLCQRELLENSRAGYRFQIELVRRWFEQSVSTINQ